MAAPKLTSQQQKKTIGNIGNKKAQKTKSKDILCTPFIAQWPEVDKEVQDQIITELVQLLNSVNLKRPVIEKKERKERKVATETFYNSLTMEEKNLRKQLICGVNEVTKKLERDEVDLVLVNKSSNILTKHLIQLAGVRNCTAVELFDLDRHICPLLSLTQLSCLGFIKLKPEDHTTFKKFINSVKASVPEIVLPWLSFEKCVSEFVKSEVDSSNSEESEDEGDSKCDYTKDNPGKTNLCTKPIVDNKSKSVKNNKGVLYDYEEPIESDNSDDIEELLKEDDILINDNTPLDFISFSNDNDARNDSVVNSEEKNLKRKNADRSEKKNKRNKKKKTQPNKEQHEFLKPEYQTLDLNKIQPNVNRKTKKKKNKN